MTTQLRIISCINLELYQILILDFFLVQTCILVHYNVNRFTNGYVLCTSISIFSKISRKVKTVHINLFAKNRKLHKFATINYLNPIQKNLSPFRKNHNPIRKNLNPSRKNLNPIQRVHR